MGRRQAERSTETVAALIAAARAQMGDRGYAHTSTEQLCTDVGLTRGALYHHFNGKEGLLEAVVRQIVRETEADVAQVWKSRAPSLESFKACCSRHMELATQPETQQIVYRDAPAVLGERLRQIDAETTAAPIAKAIATLVAAKVFREVDTEVLARLLNGAMVDAAIWIAAAETPEEMQQRSQRARATCHCLIDGLAR